MRFERVDWNGSAARFLKSAMVVACVGLMASPVLAQGRGGEGRGAGQPGQRGPGGGGMAFGGMGMGGRFGQTLFEPSMTTRDLTRYADILDLNVDQRDAARALLDAYQQEVQANSQEMRRRMEAMREGGRREEGGGFAEVREAMQKVRAQKTKLDSQFLDDLKSLLEPQQEANWARFERVHRREKGIGRGLISGERLDVFRLVEEAKLPDNTQRELQPLLAQYEEDLDRELINREKVQEQLMNRMAEMRMGPDMDMSAMQRMVEEGRQASVRVRDVNRKYVRQIQAALPEDKQFEFAKAVKEASFPEIYRETYGTRVIGVAGGLAGLDDSQRQGIAAVRESYQRDLAILNDKLAAAQEEMEMNFSVGQAFQRGGDGPLGELRRQKRELDETAVANVRKLLTQEQQDRLPQPEGRGPGRRGGDEGMDRPRGGDRGDERRGRGRDDRP